MNNAIYKTSDSSDMTKDDLITWLIAFKKLNPEYEYWCFDEITGGLDFFFCSDDYLEIKCFFENYIER